MNPLAVYLARGAKDDFLAHVILARGAKHLISVHASSSPRGYTLFASFKYFEHVGIVKKSVMLLKMTQK